MIYSPKRLIFILEEDNYGKIREREDVLKRLVDSQEVYIRELESKKYELESEMRLLRNSKNQDVDHHKNAHRDWKSLVSEVQVGFLFAHYPYRTHQFLLT